MAKFRLKIVVLRTLLALYYSVSYIGKGASVFFLWIGRGMGSVGRRALWPCVRWMYQIVFGLRLWLWNLLGPLRHTVLGVFSHRHVIHVAAVAITIVTVVMSMGTQAVRAEDRGTGSILYELVSGENDDELIEEGALDYPELFPTESFADQVAVSSVPAIDFDYLDEGYVDGVHGVALEGKPSRLAPSVAPRTEVIKYKVKEGDVVSTIAESFGLSVATVLWANNLSTYSYIRPGDELTIPPLNGVMHKVAKGDTVEKLAKKYDSDKDNILAWNKLGETGALTVGETIMIPDGRPPAAPVRRVSSPASVFTGVRPAAGTSSGGGVLFWPVASRRITQYFTWRHNGLDVGAPTGTAIYAADDGVVSFSGWKTGYGYCVFIDHGDGSSTRYGHASRLFVQTGAKVARGETIAAVGSTGNSTGPHLHFEVRISAKTKNPLEYIR